MNNFIDDISCKNEEISIEATNSYIELEIHLDYESSAYIYIIPRSSDSVFVAASFNCVFDDMLSDLDSDKFEIVCETWPTVAFLLNNALEKKYSKGVLTVFEDSDTGEDKWFVATVSGNLSFDSAEEIFTKKTLEAIGFVMMWSQKLYTELSNNKPNNLKIGARSFLRGAGEAFKGVGLAALAGYFGIDISDLM